jgi:hypothetical protein
MVQSIGVLIGRKIMRIDIYYMFVPTLALTEAAREVGEEWLLESEIQMDAAFDRTGRRHLQADIEQAFWTVFLAKLVSERPEPRTSQQFRQRCLELGFSGCWSVYVAEGGGQVDQLLAEAKEVEPLAREANSEHARE